MTLVDELVARQYTGNIKLQVLQNRYLGTDFRLAQNPVAWRLMRGEYHGRFEDKPVDFFGYWIFKFGVRQCWQAVNAGGGALQYWNADGAAEGDPQDWELFNFEAVDAANDSVRIKSNRGFYINLIGSAFSCTGDPFRAEDAIQFTVSRLPAAEPSASGGGGGGSERHGNEVIAPM